MLVSTTTARFFRWDRGSALVSRSFPYRYDPHLFEFLSQFVRLPPEVMGIDPTDSVTSKAEEDFDARPFTSI